MTASHAIQADDATRTETATPDRLGSKAALWTGRALSGVGVLFLLFDATMKVLRLAPAIENTVQLGYPVGVVFPLGLLQLACLAVYLVPRTSVLGAVLWTGYLGGAIATHVRVGNPLLTHTLFPIWVALFLWGGLWLRDARLRSLFPVRVAKWERAEGARFNPRRARASGA